MPIVQDEDVSSHFDLFCLMIEICGGDPEEVQKSLDNTEIMRTCAMGILQHILEHSPLSPLL